MTTTTASTTTHTTTATDTAPPIPISLVRGAVGGMVAAMAMAMFAMVASVTYQHNGFFTPLFHISSLTGSTDAMMRSMQEAMAGNKFWFTPGAAFTGMMIHMVTGAMLGMVFALIARVLPRKAVLPVGITYGLGAFITSAWVDLPAAANITGAGAPISDMASMVGYPTFAIEHMMYGMVLAATYLFATRHDAHGDRAAA